MRTHNSTFKNFRAIANQTMGLWFDSDNSGIVVEDSYLSRNEINGVFLEANQGPITIKNSKLCNNGTRGHPVLRHPKCRPHRESAVRQRRCAAVYR